MTMSRIGIIGSLRISPVKTIFAWFAMLSPLDLPDAAGDSAGG
jgi:hypothetical protein